MKACTGLVLVLYGTKLISDANNTAYELATSASTIGKPEFIETAAIAKKETPRSRVVSHFKLWMQLFFNLHMINLLSF